MTQGLTRKVFGIYVGNQFCRLSHVLAAVQFQTDPMGRIIVIQGANFQLRGTKFEGE